MDNPAPDRALPQSRDPDEINLLEYAYALLKRKWWIIGATLLGFVFGDIAAVVKGPRYVSEAIIEPQETETQRTSGLSGLSALSGILPISLPGNASIEKIDQVLNSREFNAKLAERYNLLPDIYRHEWRKPYRKFFDEATGRWRPGFTPPKMLGIGAFMRNKYLKKEIVKNLLTLKIATKDSTYTDSLMAHYMEYLDLYIRTSVQDEANENVTYLESRLDSIGDPLLREKVHGIIASEFEKAMVVSKKAFSIVDAPYRTRAFKEKKLYPLVFGAGLFFLSTLLVVFLHAFSSSEKTEEDRKLIEGIKRELRRVV
jgi:hypothetical protein